MPKRKAASRAKKNGAGHAKKPRRADPPAEAAAARKGQRDAALAHAQLAPQIATQTLTLVNSMKAAGGSCAERMESVVNLLTEDADRPESLIDLSLPLEGDESCVMFALLRFLQDNCDIVFDSEADELMQEKLVPLLPHLLRSFDPATVDPATGNNALHEVCRLLYDYGGWHCNLLKQLIAHGVSVHARNSQGRTPLLVVASDAEPSADSADVIHRLLARGADFHAQDAGGNGVLHLLVKRRALDAINDLCGEHRVQQPDFALLNSAGQTAADFARQLAQQQPNDLGGEEGEAEEEPQAEREEQARLVYQRVAAHTWAWTTHARPALLLCLEVVLPVIDVAQLALAYVDGSGRPFDREAPAQDE